MVGLGWGGEDFRTQAHTPDDNAKSNQSASSVSSFSLTPIFQPHPAEEMALTLPRAQLYLRDSCWAPVRSTPWSLRGPP